MEPPPTSTTADEDPAAAAWRAAASSTGVAVAHPRTRMLQQVLATAASLGPGGLLRAVRAISSGGRGEVALPAALSAPPAAASTSPSAVSADAALQIDEGLYWLAYADAAYAVTPAGVVDALRRGGVPHPDAGHLIHAQLAPAPLLQPHFVMRDPARRAMVISIRGTATVRDLIADMAARPIAFAGGAAHTGMAAAVDGLLHYRVPPALNLGGGGGGAVEEEVAGGPAAPAAAAAAPPPSAPPAPSTAPGGPPGQDNPFAYSVPYAQALVEQAAAASTTTAPGGGVGDGGGARRGFDPGRIYAPVETVGLGGVAAILQRALVAHQDHRVVVCGHSLGAGIGALLTLKLHRILLFLRRQQLEGLRGDAPPPAGAPPPGCDPALLHFLPPRPMHCWAYAPPACMSPELAALACLSVGELEGALLDDEEYLTSLVGQAAARGFLANRRAAVQGGLGASPSALDPTLPLEWAPLRRLPMVTSVVFHHDMVSGGGWGGVGGGRWGGREREEARPSFARSTPSPPRCGQTQPAAPVLNIYSSPSLPPALHRGRSLASPSTAWRGWRPPCSVRSWLSLAAAHASAAGASSAAAGAAPARRCARRRRPWRCPGRGWVLPPPPPPRPPWRARATWAH